MADPFSFDYDREIGAVRVTPGGTWSMATVTAYRAAVQALMAEAPLGARADKALYDVRESRLHTRGVAEALAEFHANHTPGMEQVAIVVASALGSLQAKRISPARTVCSFETIEAARAWLAGDRPAIAA